MTFQMYIILYITFGLYGTTIYADSCPNQCDCTVQNGRGVMNCSNANSNEEFSLPSDIPKAIEVLDLSYKSLGKVYIKLCTQLAASLTTLYLHHNELSDIEWMTDLDFQALNVLDLGYNNFLEYPKQIPNQLQVVLLNNNQISNFSPETVLTLFGKLQHLNLAANNLYSLSFSHASSSDKNSPVYNLQSLLLMDNNIHSIDDKYFTRFTNLQSLFLNNNKLSTLTENTFEGLSWLEKLDLSNNKLSSIEDNTFLSLTSLKYLNLQANHIHSVNFNLPLLEVLDLSHNQISTISEEYKSYLYPVEYLYFGNNPFQCDCNLIWLKELYDRKTSQNYFIINNPSVISTVPTCAAPEYLAGDSWDFISVDLFKCLNHLEQPKELEDNDVKIETSNKQQLSINDLKVKKEAVTNATITFIWNLKMNAMLIQNVFIHYYVFGSIDSSLKFVEVSAFQRKYTLKHLIPNTNYIVCVIPKMSETQNIETATPLSYKHCLEFVTLHNFYTVRSVSDFVSLLSESEHAFHSFTVAIQFIVLSIAWLYICFVKLRSRLKHIEILNNNVKLKSELFQFMSAGLDNESRLFKSLCAKEVQIIEKLSSLWKENVEAKSLIIKYPTALLGEQREISHKLVEMLRSDSEIFSSILESLNSSDQEIDNEQKENDVLKQNNKQRENDDVENENDEEKKNDEHKENSKQRENDDEIDEQSVNNEQEIDEQKKNVNKEQDIGARFSNDYVVIAEQDEYVESQVEVTEQDITNIQSNNLDLSLEQSYLINSNQDDKVEHCMISAKDIGRVQPELKSRLENNDIRARKNAANASAD